MNETENFFGDTKMERITQKDLEYLVKRINEITGSPIDYCTKVPSGMPIPNTNIGNYHLDYAYGGVKLVRTVNKHGGITIISTGGYGTKRELYNWISAFLLGLDSA